MPSFTAATLAATAFAALGLAAPTARNTSPPQYYLEATSVYTDGTPTYSNTKLNTCHTAAGVEALCAFDVNNPALFGLDTDSKNIFYNLNVGTATPDKQYLSFTQNTTVPTLAYGFFGSTGDVYQFSVGENNAISRVSTDPGNSTFYICPEYVDYNHEGYETLSVVGDYSALPANSGCNAVTLRFFDPSVPATN